ncbi:MAG: tetratricopeptide repeat protein [Lentisphaerae bacterium]|nr:tetratricopeptide repeat protein [Lentisphaerota bacterium]
MSSDTNSLDRRLGAGLGLLAFAVYLLTLSAGAFPGESARLLAESAGAAPRLSPMHPLWFALMAVLRVLPLAGFAFRGNLLSAVLGAASVGLLFGVVRDAVRMASDARIPADRLRAARAARLAGTGAALFFAFCIPFWFTATRAHTAPVGVLMLLLTARLFMRYAATGRTRDLALTAFVYGLGIVEFATFILFAPLLAAGAALVMWRREAWRPGAAGAAALSVLGGLLLYLPAAWSFYGTEGYAARGYDHFFEIIWFFWRDQYWLIKRSLPPVGWLIVIAATIVPWLACLAVARRGLNGERDWGFYVLHLVLAGIAAGLLLNLQFAPWSMIGLQRLLVTPYLLGAMVFGYLCAYAYLLPDAWRREGDTPRVRARRQAAGVLCAAILFVPAVAAPFRNLPETNGRAARFVNVIARETIGALDGREWVVTDGSIDPHLLIAAHDAGRPLRVLNLRQANNESYLRYVADQFDSPRLKNLALIGLVPMLQDWLGSETNTADTVAVMALPDLWLGAGLTPVPDRTLFKGARNPSELDVGALIADHARFWDRVEPLLAGPRNAETEEAGRIVRRLLAWYRAHLARRVGMAANNLGVLLEDLGRPEAAFDAYRRARTMDADNISALLNQAAMLDRGYESAQADAIRAELDALLESDAQRPGMWALARYYGYVRLPQAFAELGWGWARSGQPGLAVTGLQKAIDLLPEGKRTGARQLLADAYLMQEEDEAGEALYYELLVENPENTRALLGSARIAARKGDFRKAREFLDRAEAAGVPKLTIALEWGSMHLMAGNYDQARVIVEEIVDLNPDSLRGWALLAGILVEQEDRDALGEVIDALERLDPEGGIVMAVKGQSAWMHGDLDGARTWLNRALRKRADNRHIVELLLRLDLVQNKQAEARTHARLLLLRDPSHAFANYVMGTILMSEGDYDMAEQSMRRSLESKLTAAALNDLAWLVQQRGRYERAEKYVRAALKMEPKLAAAWDTLGEILMRTDRLDEAEQALERSLALFQDNLRVYAHMAEVQARLGNVKRARELVDMLVTKRNFLPAAEQERLARVRDMLGE